MCESQTEIQSSRAASLSDKPASRGEVPASHPCQPASHGNEPVIRWKILVIRSVIRRVIAATRRILVVTCRAQRGDPQGQFLWPAAVFSRQWILAKAILLFEGILLSHSRAIGAGASAGAGLHHTSNQSAGVRWACVQFPPKRDEVPVESSDTSWKHALRQGPSS